MASVKTVAELLLLSCLLLIVTSSPIQDKKNSRTARGFRTKTAGASLQHPFLSSTRKVPEATANGARDSSNLRPSAGIKTKHRPITIQGIGAIAPEVVQDADKGSELTAEDAQQQVPSSDSPTQTFRTPGSQSHLPAISNFGVRINGAKSAGCRIKGGCRTVSFTPDGGISVNGAPSSTNGFEQDHQQSVSDVPHDEQQQFAGPSESTATGISEIGQTAHDVDYEGLVSPPDFPSVKGGQVTTIQEDHTDEGNTEIVSADVPDHTGFDQQTQVVTQEDFSDGPQQPHESTVPAQEVIPIEPSSAPESFPPEQTHTKIHSGVKGHRNNGRTSQFDQQLAPPSFISNIQGTVIQQQVNGQPESPDFAPDTQAAVIQQQINGQTTAPDFAPDSQEHVTQDQVIDQQTFPNFPQISDDGQYHHYGNPIDWLRSSVPGSPGVDYPIFYSVPQTSFDCKQQQFSAGIYGDMQAACQAFHICKEGGGQDSFLCPNGTIFNQQYFVCDWWYNFKCEDTPSFYNLNADLYWDWDNFAPSQVLNGQSVIDDQLSPSFQTGSQDSFNNIPVSEDGRSAVSVNHHISGQNDAVKSTIAIDNSAITNIDHLIPEQIPEEHAFSNGQKNQDYDQQVQQEFSQESFSDATAGQQPVTDSHFDDGRNDQSVFPVSSDNGANGQPGGNSGTRFPDQVEDDVDQQLIEQTFVTQGAGSFDNGRDGTYFTQTRDDAVDFQNGPDTSVTDADQLPAEFPANGGSDIPVIDQVHQVQQEHIHNNFDNIPSTFGTGDQGFDQHDFSTPGIAPNNVPTTDIHDTNLSPDVQQQISTSFDSKRQNDFQDQNLGTFVPQIENTGLEDTRTTPFDDGNGNIETGISQEDQQQGIQQELVTDSFDVGNQNIQDTGNFHTNGPFGNGQIFTVSQSEFGTNDFNGNGNVGQEYTPQELNGDSITNTNEYNNNQDTQTDSGAFAINGNGRNSNGNVQQTVQQEFVPEFDGENINGPTTNDSPVSFGPIENNQEQNVQQELVPAFNGENIDGPNANESPASFEHINNNQGQTIIPFQPNNQEGNLGITQDHISVTFDQQTINPFSNSGVGDSSPYDHTNKNIQQENVIFPFNGNSHTNGNSNENGNNFYNAPQRQISSFSGNGQINYNRDQGGVHGDNRNPNEQQYDSGRVNADQGSGFGRNQQNNFRPSGDQPYFHPPQAFRQENFPVNVNNDYENHDQNNFRQENNYRPIQNQIQNEYQGSPVNGGNAGLHQNTNEAFRIRLNNFQPENIHLMNRGQFQNENLQQERVSFRPYGQNVPNAVSFPESGPLTLVTNQENGAALNYNNNKGSSNRNFFITNGHQVHNVHPAPQQPNGQGFSNDQPVNDVQDVKQYGPQDFNQVQFNNNPVAYDGNQGDGPNTGINQQGSFLGNNAPNSGIKGNFYRRSLDTSEPIAADMPRGYPTEYSQQESPNSMINNGWKPVVKQ